MMKWAEVNSKSLFAIGYDRARRILSLEYRPEAKVYRYFDVPPEEHQAFLDAKSKGEYLNFVFKPKKYRYEGPVSGGRQAA